jgi:hypothetical protein
VSTLGDDFAALIEDLNAARVGADGAAREELDALATLRETERRKQDREVPRVLITPPSARKGVLGMAAKVANGAPAQRVIQWAADRMDESIPLSIALAIVDTDPSGNYATGGAQNRAYANIYWLGGRGVPTVAQVDVGKGRIVNIHGAFCAVDVGLDAGNANGAMSVGAWLSFYSTMRPTPATRTLYIDALANGTTKNVIIPPFATELLPLQRSDQATGTCRLDFKDFNGTIVAAVALAAGGTMATPIPLSDDCHSVDFVNTGATTTTARLVFGLSL